DARTALNQRNEHVERRARQVDARPFAPQDPPDGVEHVRAERVVTGGRLRLIRGDRRLSGNSLMVLMHLDPIPRHVAGTAAGTCRTPKNTKGRRSAAPSPALRNLASSERNSSYRVIDSLPPPRADDRRQRDAGPDQRPATTAREGDPANHDRHDL